MVKTKGYFPNPTDVYDPSKPGNGNTNYLNPAFYDTLEWVSNKHGQIDIRLFYTSYGPDSWNKCRWTDGEPT